MAFAAGRCEERLPEVLQCQRLVAATEVVARVLRPRALAEALLDLDGDRAWVEAELAPIFTA